ncbi:MAG: N-methyl-L-tryptophan oxidase [Candidatus Hydrogenedentes bacterium]|nr:N-methyl-L-tryptophan oxidase [Candidatus Hydrogenedentota bacterium]
MGSAALYHLAKRGARICGVERLGVAHDRGSSHGSLRMIRKAYFEHPDYIPLVERAYELWRALEVESGKSLLTECGLLLSGRPDFTLIRGLEECYGQHDLPHERLTAGEAMRRYPQFRLPEDHAAFWDPVGGYLRVEECVATHLALAQLHGADVLAHEDVLSWSSADDLVTVTTDQRTLQAKCLVLTAGAWMGAVFAELRAPFRVLRKVQLWYDSPNRARYEAGAFPGFYVDTDYGGFYGFPAVDETGMKIAEHTGGEEVSNPDELDRGLHSQDEAKILKFLGETFLGMQPRRTKFSACMYSMSADGNFIVDRHARFANVVLAGGFSGHGFKFASVIGEILTDLALEGRTRHPVEFLGLSRFANHAAR